MKALWGWLDHRSGLGNLMHEALYERIPGGSRWRYVWGSTLVFTFVAQVITGTFLWLSYSPSAQTAWESVYYIQYEMQGGWLLRGLHHYFAQAMVVLLALHLMQVVIDGAYRAPREMNFWIGLVLMQIVLGLSLTGYLLPWDEKGYWATQVATKLMGVIPVVGESMQKLVVGGTNYGHLTLTRFFALHAGVLPGTLILFLAVHIYLFRRHGIHAITADDRPEATFWPDQVLKDAVACLAVLAVVLGLNLWPALTSSGRTPGDYLGAHLGAPADPASAYSAARPEWYFLFLFQFLKLFHGETQEFIGAVVIPGAVMGFLFLMPFLGRWKLGHHFNVVYLAIVFLGIVGLTIAAVWEDRSDAGYAIAVENAHDNAARARELASGPDGIPPTGAITLLRRDPKTQGPALFAQRCASCHQHDDIAVVAAEPKAEGEQAVAPASAPNLTNFGSRVWLTGLLNAQRIAGPEYFGGTKHVDGEMVGWVKDNLAEPDAAKQADLAKLITALSAEAHLPAQVAADAKDQAAIEAGRTILIGDMGCMDCHRFHDKGEAGVGPDLTGYASRDWLIAFIGNPGHEQFYGDKNDRMPAFAVNPSSPDTNILSEAQIGLIVDWLRGDWYEPSAGSEKAEHESPAAAKPADADPAAAKATDKPAAAGEAVAVPATAPATTPDAAAPAAEAPATAESAATP